MKLNYNFNPPVDWQQRCSRYSSLFQQATWHKVLSRGFNAKTLYIWSEDQVIAFSINIFKVGPFRIGYLGFPVGSTLGDTLEQQHLTSLRHAKLPIDVLRIPVSAFLSSTPYRLASVGVPETCITNLQNWQLESLPKLRRDINKARRSSFTIHDLTNQDSGLTLYEMYRTTVLAHGGTIKYTPEYFRSLLDLTNESAQLRCLGAYHEDELCGFVVIALDSNTGYYLHGATATKWRRSGVSDLLVYTGVEWAKEQGMRHFNLMTSPAIQPGLIRYKEKFGATTLTHLTYELQLSPLRAYLFNMAVGLHKLIHQISNSRLW